MSEQILIASERKENLNQNDLESIQHSVEKSYRISVNSTKNTIISSKQELQDSINRVTELYYRGMQLKNDLLFYQNKMTLIIDKNREIHEQAEYQKKQILIARQKLFIFNTLNEISKLNKEIQENYQKRNVSPSFVETFKTFKNRTSILKLDKLYSDTFNQCQSYFKKDINTYFSPNEKEFSLENLSKKSEILTFFELIPTLLESFWNFINSTFLHSLSSSKNKLNITKDKVSIEIEKTNEKNNSTDFIKSSTILLEAIIDKFNSLNIKINDEDIANYANNSIEIGLGLQGGQFQFLNDETAKLCKLANIPKVNLTDVMKQARLPMALDRCRQLLKEGKPFGVVITEMRQIMEGTNTDGVLKQITAMATYFWKDDKAKLQLAINPLISIGTPEALECVMMFDNAIH
ncbi:hypothetical protein M9Y10_024000 [Tritrichomonas musculus]|uniref:Uncharacterized protein n=1 Tax=Tritrichomonas musculus TaxID=1915356 RepID=A0ABR2KXF5_9EUKA